MPVLKSHKIVLAARPVGEPKPDDFRLVEERVGEPGPGEVLLKTLWLSLDPYMRGRMSAAKSYADPVEIGQVMPGGAVSKVVATNNKAYAAGVSSSAIPAGRSTRSPTAAGCARLIRNWRRFPPRSAFSACRG